MHVCTACCNISVSNISMYLSHIQCVPVKNPIKSEKTEISISSLYSLVYQDDCFRSKLNLNES